MQSKFKLTSVIVPFYNEEKLLKTSVENLLIEQFNKEVILINDGSSDNSRNIALNIEAAYPNVILLDSNENMGKGHAVKLGLSVAKGDFISIFDADLEYSPTDLHNIIKYIQNENLDFVCGSRFMGYEDRRNIYMRTYIANKFLSYLFSIVHNNKITDIATCLKVFRKEIIKNVSIEMNGFEIEVELIAKALQQTNKYKEFPISYNARSYKEGKKIKIIDGFRYINAILNFR